MNVTKVNTARAIALGTVVSVILFLILIEYAPDSVSFSANNYGWDGLKDVASNYRVNFTNSYASLPQNSVLVMMQPTVTYTPGDIQGVRSFLAKGGTVLIADKSGLANSLLSGLGAGVSIESGLVVNDPIYNWKAQTTPTALVVPGTSSTFPSVTNVTGLAFSGPAPLSVTGKATRLAESSPLSYSVNASQSSGFLGVVGQQQPQLAKGPFAVLSGQKLLNGTLYVVGDSQFILNSEWNIADNEQFIANLFSTRNVFVDSSHWATSPVTSSSAQLKVEVAAAYSVVSAVPARYFATLGIIAFAVGLTPLPRNAERDRGDEPRATTLNNETAKRPAKREP